MNMRHRYATVHSNTLSGCPAVWLTSIGSCAFPTVGARIEHAIPLHVTSASSLTVFKQRLKLHLFCFSFSFHGLSLVWLHLGHYKNWLIDLFIESHELDKHSYDTKQRFLPFSRHNHNVKNTLRLCIYAIHTEAPDGHIECSAVHLQDFIVSIS